MKVDYRLAESVVVVSGTITRVTDHKAATENREYAEADVEVLLTVRGDVGAGQQVLSIEGGRGDDDFTVELSPDQRLTALTYKSVGAGSRVVAAGATLVATVAGLAVRAAGRALPKGAPIAHGFAAPVAEDAARQEWEDSHAAAVAHRAAYAEVLAGATAGVLAARRAAVASTSQAELADAVSRAYRLEGVAAAARREVDKVDTLYRLWRDSFRWRRTEVLAHSLSVDALPLHGEGPPATGDLDGVMRTLWEALGVVVEIGPADGYDRLRPAPDAGGGRDRSESLWWRVPRPARFWVWRRAGDEPVLERSFEAAVVDRFSATRRMPLEAGWFGDHGGAIAFDALGAPAKIVRTERGALGAFADAVGGVPASVASGLDSATKISASLVSLADAAGKRRLDLLAQEVAVRSKELEQRGLDATADEFAELKRLQQEVALAKARAELPVETASPATPAPPAAEAAHSRALDAELAAAQAEIARLSAELRAAGAGRGGAGA